MQLSDELREIIRELASSAQDRGVRQPLFHTVTQCLFLKKDIILERMKDESESRLVRIQCELFLDWLDKQPCSPFRTAQSEDSLQEKVRVLSLNEQLLLFDMLEDLRDAVVNYGDREESWLDLLGSYWMGDEEAF